MAQWIFDSGPAFFISLFGGTTEAKVTLESWLHRPNSEFSGLRATLALDPEPVGMFIAIPGAEIAASRRADLFALIQATAATDRLVLKEKLQGLGELTAPVEPDDYYIRTVAIDAARRGKGFGRQILRRALEDGRAAGFKRFRLDVDSGNEVAQNLYRSVGFEPIYEGAAPEFGVRMQSLLLRD